MSKTIIGECKLCGCTKELTFEHVPPEKSYNSSSVKKFTGNEAMKLFAGTDGRMPWETEGLKGKIQQRGSGDYYLCKECNNNTGSWYMTEYVKFSHTMGQILLHAITNDPPLSMLSVKLEPFYPLRVIKGILTMFCDINYGCMGDDSLRSFLLNKESTNFNSKKYSLYMYLSKGPMWRIQGVSALGSLNGSIICLSEISTLPVGFLMITDNTSNRPIPGLCLNDFANFKYDEKATAELINLPIFEVNSQMPMDFRNKSEIIQCINENKLAMNALLRKEVSE